MSDEYLNPDDEQAEAERRIDNIIHGGAAQPQRRQESMRDPLDDEYESEAVSRARGRAQQTRVNLGMADEQPRSRSSGRRTMSASGGVVSGRTMSALMWIGGLVGVGILIVVIIIFAAKAMGAGGNIDFELGATDTPFPTETPAITNTPAVTRAIPNLALPGLACIFQSGGGCSDYCAQPANLSECNSSKAFIEAQGVKWDFWLKCVSPGPGPNTGDAQQCMRDGWLANNP